MNINHMLKKRERTVQYNFQTEVKILVQNTHKYEIQLPRSHKECSEIDKAKRTPEKVY